MLIFILIATAIIVGGSVLVGTMLNGANQRRPRRERRDPGAPLSRDEKMNMLKASGALKHRKSNR
ncbi:hypothetical protein [Terricaulis sp.]|uniref:hypothetical protein n=1 Tax=Terricaulis sp. TaxID=2768686 RepID=UPI0037842888